MTFFIYVYTNNWFWSFGPTTKSKGYNYYAMKIKGQ